MSEANIPLEFKSATLYALRAVLHNEDAEAAITELDRHMADAGSFFRGEPVVIDASNLTAAPDWARLLKAFEAHELPVIGIVANEAIANTALEHGLHVLDLSAAAAGTTTRSAAQAAQNAQETTPVPVVDASQAERVKPAAETPEPAQPTMVVEGPLRSGQRVYARATDLVVMGVVSQGAEVIADGNIHVYGPLRGKAMAGARGDTQARIFTTAMDAELVAIAGVYRVIDAPLEDKLVRQPAVVSLDGQSLRLEPLKA